MKKYILILLLLVLVSGCSKQKEDSQTETYENSKNALINVLENVGFICDMDSNICSKDVTDNSNGLYSYEFDFDTYTYSDTFSTVVNVNGVRSFSSIKCKYNWKTDYAESNVIMEGDPNDGSYVIIDDKGDFSCMSRDDNICYSLKAKLMSSKNTFLHYITTADIELEDIQ